MATTPHTVVAATLTLVAAVASAGEMADVSTATASASPAAQVSPRMTWRVEAKLERAFALATRQLETVPACRELFAELGSNGFERLAATRYYPASPHLELKTCRRAVAATRVGSPATSVCRRFDAISDSRAAMVVLHEALHFAGLEEGGPGEMSSNDINEMVRSACAL
jgi:hypothetical protein